MQAERRSWRFDPDDTESLLRGLGIMATGGGGSPEFGCAIIENDVKHGRCYDIAPSTQIPDNALVVSGGIIGSVKALESFSPREVVARWEEHFELLEAFRAMETYLGRKVDYLVPFELGGLNTPVIFSLAARLGIPVIDGDGIGRAAPETQMTSFFGHGVSIVPMPLVDWLGNVIIVKKANSPFFPDEVGRFVATHSGGIGANTHYPMTGFTARNVIVPNTISAALSLGRKVCSLSEPHEIAKTVAKHVKGLIAFRGWIAEIKEHAVAGFLTREVKLEGVGRFDEQLLKLTIQNEYMMASSDGRPICIFPDLIIVLNETGHGVMSVEMEVGQTVDVIFAPCHPRLREAALSKMGQAGLRPGRFGQQEKCDQPVESIERDGEDHVR